MSETTHSLEHDLKQALKAADSELEARNKELESTAAETEQKVSEFETAFSSVSEAMVVYDASGQPVMANPAAVAAFGFDPSKLNREVASRKLALRFPNEKRVPLDDLPSSRALKGIKVANERYVLTNEEGKDLTVLTSASPLVSRGRVSGAVVVWRDVTELENLREKIESQSAELKIANENLRREAQQKDEAMALVNALFEAAPIGLGFWDRDLRFTRLNKALADINGLPVEDHLGKKVDEIVPKLGDIHDLKADWRRIIETGEPMLNVEISGETPACPGVIRHWVDNWYPVHLGEEIIGIAATVMDVTEHRQADDLLRQSEEKYRTILENMEEGYCEVDLAGNFVFVNPAFARMSGYSQDELIGANYARFLDAETARKAYQAFKGVYVSGEPSKGFEWIVARKDGTAFTMQISISLIRDREGRVIGFRGIASDVTEQRRMETRLREERARLETIVESAPVAIVVADKECRIILANKQAAALYGRPVPYAEGFESHYKLHLCYPNGSPYNPNDLPLTRSVFHGESFSEVEMAVIWPDGTRKDLLVNSTPIIDPSGNVVGAVGTFQDVTLFLAQREELRKIRRDLEKRVTEQTAELVQSKEVLESIIHHIPVMLCFYDPNGRVKLINSEFKQRIGWGLEEVGATDIMEGCYPESEYRQEVWDYMMEAKPGWRDLKVTTRDGSILNSSWANVRLSDGSQIGIGLDITQRLQYEESLRRKNEELELEIKKRKGFEKDLKASTEKIIREHEQRKYLARRLVDLLEKDRRDVAMALHDEIGQILTRLKMDLELAESRLIDDPYQIRERLDTAKEKALEVLSFAKHISGQLRPSTLDALGLTPTVRSLISKIRETTDSEIHFFTKGLPDRLESEKELALYRIVQESLTNVLKHAGAREVFVNLIRRDETIVLSVEDDGQGFDSNQIIQSGIGKTDPLGLTIMRERAVQCDGTFRIESQPGKGTQVMVEIPI